MASAGKPLSELAAEFQQTNPLDARSADLSLAAIPLLEQLLGLLGAALTDLVRGQPVLVLGPGEPSVAAFLESLGCAVAISDGATTAPPAPYGLALVTSGDAQLPALALLADYCYLPAPAAPDQLKLAGWELCASLPTGACLLRRTDLFTNGRLLDGWYPAEGPRDGWRWAADLFRIRFQTPHHGWVRFIYFVPPHRFEATGPFTVGAMLAGQVLASQSVTQPGLYHLEVPVLHPTKPATDLTFWATPAATAPGDERLLGAIIHQILFTPAA